MQRQQDNVCSPSLCRKMYDATKHVQKVILRRTRAYTHMYILIGLCLGYVHTLLCKVNVVSIRFFYHISASHVRI